MDDVRDEGPRTGLASQLRHAKDPELLITQLTVADLERRDPALATAYTASALPRRFNREVIDRLVLRAQPGSNNAEAFDQLLMLSEVRQRRDGYYSLHDSARSPLLRYWKTSGDEVLWAALHDELVDHFRDQHRRGREAEEQLALCRQVVSEVSWERYVQLSRTVERRMSWPLAEALYHRVASAPSKALVELVDDFNENQGSGRLTTCSVIVDTFFDAVMELTEGEEQKRLRQWAVYFQVRIFLSLEDFAGAAVVLRVLEGEGVVDPILRIWVIDELAAAARGQFQLDRALELRHRAVRDRREGKADLKNLSVALGDLGRAHLDLWYNAEALRAYRAALSLAQAEENADAAFNVLTDLALALASNGRAIEAAAALLGLFHLARTGRLRVSHAQRLAATAMDVFVLCDPRQAETAYAEARALFAPDASPSRLLDFDKDYLDSLAAGDLVARAQHLEKTRLSDLGIGSSQVRARALLARARAAFARSDMAATLAFGVAVLDLHREVTVEPWQCAGARTDAALASLEMARFVEAERLLDLALQDWRAMGHERGQALVSIYRAEVARRRGDLHTAEDILRAGEIFVGTGGVGESEYQAVYADVLRGRGCWRTAMLRARRAAEIALANGRLRSSCDVLTRLVLLANRAGDNAGAKAATAALTRAVDELADRTTWLPSAEEEAADRANAQATVAITTQSSKRTAVLEGAATLLRKAMDRDARPFWYALNLAYVELELGHGQGVAWALNEARGRAASGPFAAALDQLSAWILPMASDERT